MFLNDSKKRTRRLATVLVAALVGVFYLLTMSRWIGLGDTAMIIDDMVQLNVNSHVNNHSLSIVFGHLFSLLPFGGIALRCNLMSVFFGTLSMTLFYAVSFQITKRYVPSILATLSTAVMHSMWWHSTIVENYAINSAFLLGVMLCILKDDGKRSDGLVYAAAFLSGLAIFNHVQMGILLFVTIVYTVARECRGGRVTREAVKATLKRLIMVAAFYLAGLTPSIYFLARDLLTKGDPVGVLHWATGGDFKGIMFDFSPAYMVKSLFQEFLIQFPTPYALVIGLGAYVCIRKKRYWRSNLAILTAFLVNTVFFMQYHTWDKFAFLLPSFLIAAYAGIYGAAEMHRWIAGRALALRIAFSLFFLICLTAPPLFYDNLPQWGSGPGFWNGRYSNSYTENSHDCAEYCADPDKSDFSDIHEFATLIFETLPPNSILFDDDSRTYYPLHGYYQKHYGMREDLEIVLMNSWGFENWGMSERNIITVIKYIVQSRDIFLVSDRHPFSGVIQSLYGSGIVPERYELDDERWIYRLVPCDPEKIRTERLLLTGMHVGTGFDTQRPSMRGEFGRDEDVMVEVEFIHNRGPIPIQFRWIDPAEVEYFASEPYLIPEGNTGCWSYMGTQGRRHRGTWRVEALVNGQVAGSASFELKDRV